MLKVSGITQQRARAQGAPKGDLSTLCTSATVRLPAPSSVAFPGAEPGLPLPLKRRLLPGYVEMPNICSCGSPGLGLAASDHPRHPQT